MQTHLHERFQNHPEADTAEAILRACVHCGFCNATCPTYLDLNDERDGPRGRIYLIKQLLETGSATEKTQQHIDRCLTCRNCETTCPSGVQYGKLVDIGRGILENDVQRPLSIRLTRWLITAIVPHAARFAAVLAMGRIARPFLPNALARKIPQRQAPTNRPAAQHLRSMIALEGCAQASATPNTNNAAARVLDKLGISLTSAPSAGCCGALHYHLGEHTAGMDFMRRNIDAWWPLIEQGTEAIVITASGCGATIKDYGHILRNDPQYGEKAKEISRLAKDISEVLATENLDTLIVNPTKQRLALHCPCTLQHAQKLGGHLEQLLQRIGLKLTTSKDSHLCCGSAGSYSILQPEISARLRDKKVAALTKDGPDAIVTANVGCQLHLASSAAVPVKHWIEVVDDASSSQRSK